MEQVIFQPPEHNIPSPNLEVCDLDLEQGRVCVLQTFRCYECDFDLDIGCALSTLSDRGDSSRGKTSEQISLPLHHHLLTSFSTRHDFVSEGDCVICKARVEGEEEWYMCLRSRCRFIIHKRCIHDLYYADGTKAPRVYHPHPLEIFVGESTGSIECARCESEGSSEVFIGCARCQVFIHRDCIQVPEIVLYPHHLDHKLVLLINSPENHQRQCKSCSDLLNGELCYGCTSCEFFAHVGCALQVLSYCEEGSSAQIELSWHEHPLLLCQTNKYGPCYYCEDKSDGPMYECKKEDCYLVLHKRCTEIKSTIIHPHHPDHPLTLCQNDYLLSCKACCQIIVGLSFSCKLCAFHLHTKCAAHFPNRKHYLHEHELLQLDKARFLECNRCGTSRVSSVFRCVPCDLNLHKECMELPPVVKHDTHVHPLTLREFYREDDSDEYYCDLCGERRDGRLGVYVCEVCNVTWAFQIECVLPELRKVFEKKSQTSAIKGLEERIVEKKEEVQTVKEKLEKVEKELDEMVRKHAELISKVEKEGRTSVINILNERIARKDEEFRAAEERMKRELDRLKMERDELMNKRDELISRQD